MYALAYFQILCALHHSAYCQVGVFISHEKLHSIVNHTELYNFGCTPNFYNRRRWVILHARGRCGYNALWLVAAYKFTIRTFRFSLIDDAPHKTWISSHYFACAIYRYNESSCWNLFSSQINPLIFVLLLRLRTVTVSDRTLTDEVACY